MPHPPGVGVSQIATQLEAFDQMRLELVSFPDAADVASLSLCAVAAWYARSLLPPREPPAPKLSGYTQSGGRPVSIPHSEAPETAVATAAPLGRKSSFFGDLLTQDAISGYLDNSGAPHKSQGEVLYVGPGEPGYVFIVPTLLMRPSKYARIIFLERAFPTENR